MKRVLFIILIVLPIFLWGKGSYDRKNQEGGRGHPVSWQEQQLSILAAFGEGNNDGRIDNCLPVFPGRDHCPINEVNHEETPKEKIKKVLKEYQSPLAPFADTFASVADRYGLNPYLLPALAGCESTFGKRGCGFNPFGWDNCRSGFDDYVSAISTVGKALAQSSHYEEWRKNPSNIHALALTYKAVPPYEIWEACVKGFMEEMR